MSKPRSTAARSLSLLAVCGYAFAGLGMMSLAQACAANGSGQREPGGNGGNAGASEAQGGSQTGGSPDNGGGGKGGQSTGGASAGGNGGSIVGGSTSSQGGKGGTSAGSTGGSPSGGSSSGGSSSGGTMAGTGGVQGGQAGGPVPGQIIADPSHPGALVYNRDNDKNGQLDPFVLVSPGDPEGFLYLPAKEQNAIIDKLTAFGGNGLYLQVVRSHGGDGGGSQNPFVQNDPQKGLDQAVLNAWETLFTRLDDAGIVIYLFLYDDGASPFGSGDTVPNAEKMFLEGIVAKFSHHRHLMWCVAEEYKDALSASRVKAIASIIAAADKRKHVLAVHHATGDNTFDFVGSDTLTQFAHQPNSTSAADLHADVLTAIASTGGKMSVNMAENWNNGVNDHAAAVKSGNRQEIRMRNWATAMAGAHVMVVGTWHPTVGAPVSNDVLADMRRLQNFLEKTSFNEMKSGDAMAAGDARWVLASKRAYVAFASSGSMLGIKDLPAGKYRLLWLDAVTGATSEQEVIHPATGTAVWPKPANFGNETALDLRCTKCPL